MATEMTITQFWKLVDYGVTAFRLPTVCESLTANESACRYRYHSDWWHKISFDTERSVHVLYELKRNRLQLTYSMIDAGVDNCAIALNGWPLIDVMASLSNQRLPPHGRVLSALAAELPDFMLKNL